MKKIINSINLKTIIQTLIVIGIVSVALFYKSTGRTVIAENPDSVVVLDSEHLYLTQSYQIPNRNICGVEIPVDLSQSTDISGRLICEISRNQDGSEVLCRNEVELEAERDSYLFNMPESKLEPGRRVYIRLTLEPENATAKLAIPAFSDYAGCQLAGQEYEGAICASLLYRYAGNLAGIAAILLTFGAIALMITAISGRDFASTIGMAFCIVFVWMFMWGIFGRLNVGYISLRVVTSIIAILLPLLFSVNSRKLTDWLSPGLIGFGILFLVYFIFDRNVILGKADDLNQWQLAVRDMWFSDSYAYHIGNAYITPRYTPGLATLEYLFARIYGTYREGILLLAAHTTGLAFMSPILSRISWKRAVRVPFLLLLIATLPLLIFCQYSGILYVDSYLGIVGAYLFICYFTEEYSLFQLIRISLGTVFLIMVKEFGLVIAFTFYVAVIIDICINNKGFKGFWKRSDTKRYFCSGAISILSFGLWELYCGIGTRRLLKLDEYSGVGQSIAETVSVTSSAIVGQSATGTSKFYSPMTSVKSLARWMVEGDVYLNQSFLQLVIILAFIALLVIASGIFSKERVIRYKSMVISLGTGLLIYLGALLLTYIFIFNEDSAIPAEERYVGSFVLLIIIAVIGTFIIGINVISDKIWIGSLVIAGLCLSTAFILPKYNPYYTTEENFGAYYSNWRVYQTISEPIRTFADKGDNIFFIGYETNPDYIYENYITFHNAIIPCNSQGFEDWRPVTDADVDYGIATRVYSSDGMEHLLSGYDYLYLRDYDEYFLENYAGIFGDEPIVSGGIYRINVLGEGDVCLKKIANKDLN